MAFGGRLITVICILISLTRLTLSNEICRSDYGYMKLSEETKILTIFKKDNDTFNTVLIDDELEIREYLEKEYVFTCYRAQNQIDNKEEMNSDLIGQEENTHVLTLVHFWIFFYSNQLLVLLKWLNTNLRK